VPVLPGAAERLACRLIAVRVPQEVAARRRQEARAKARKHGRAPSREYLRWQDWTIFVTDWGPDRLTWEAVVVLYRARSQVELLFKLWKSPGGPAAHRAGAPPQEQSAVVYAKLIGGRRAVDRAGLLVGLTDPRDEPVAAGGRRARRPVPPGVVAAAGDAEHLA
jgi:hypothetical protein